MPTDFVRETSICYRTLFHRHKTDYVTGSQYIEVVFGDSYSEGMGDEFLNGESNYGLFNKLAEVDRNIVLFGRSGFGSIASAAEDIRCGRLLSNFTNYNYSRQSVTHITFLFYEGNDLNDNLRELANTSDDLVYNLRFMFPLFEYLYVKLRGYGGRLIRLGYNSELISDAAGSPQKLLPVSDSGILIGKFPQSAATELTENEVTLSINTLESSLAQISRRYPNANKQFLYIPSVASSYDFKGPMRVESNYGRNFSVTSGSTNFLRSLDIRSRVELLTTKAGWRFCDSTNEVLYFTRQGLPAHGPLDWRHFNETGYTALKNAYLACFLL